MLVACTARTGSRASVARFSTTRRALNPTTHGIARYHDRHHCPTGITTCLAPQRRLEPPLEFDPLDFHFDQGAGNSTGPLCGTIDDFLTEEECGRLIDFTTSQGYEPAKTKLSHDGRQEPITQDRLLHLSGRAVIESQRFADLLWERLAPIVPAIRAGWEPAGLNEHFRFLRYVPGDYFRPHRDANYVREETDPRYGEVSFQSLLIYLDSPSKGGETFFPAARLSEDNKLRLRLRLAPKSGRALCFDQTLEHGSVELQEGVKHLMRTDVMYRCLPGTVPPKWITAKRRYLT